MTGAALGAAMNSRAVVLGMTAALALPEWVAAADVPTPDVEATRRVVRAVVAEADRLAWIGTARRGDDLTDFYVRAAAAEARRLPRAQAVPAFLAALGIALDDS